MNTKSFTDLTVADILACPIWRFTNRSNNDDLEIEPVHARPCQKLDDMIVGTELVLADGSKMWALLQNIDIHNASLNEHFLTVTLDCGGKWFPLARYHDIDIDDSGPTALAEVLKRSLSQVFPIKFDIQEEVGSDAPGTTGKVRHVPLNPLTRPEIIKLALS
jgi:hypothetical protein